MSGGLSGRRRQWRIYLDTCRAHPESRRTIVQADALHGHAARRARGEDRARGEEGAQRGGRGRAARRARGEECARRGGWRGGRAARRARSEERGRGEENGVMVRFEVEAPKCCSANTACLSYFDSL